MPFWPTIDVMEDSDRCTKNSWASCVQMLLGIVAKTTAALITGSDPPLLPLRRITQLSPCKADLGLRVHRCTFGIGMTVTFKSEFDHLKREFNALPNALQQWSVGFQLPACDDGCRADLPAVQDRALPAKRRRMILVQQSQDLFFDDTTMGFICKRGSSG